MTHGTYHKIYGLYKRNEKGRFTKEFSKPEFGYLFHQLWNWTEKVDGTNIRIGLNGGELDIRGKTDNAQLAEDLVHNIKGLLCPSPAHNGDAEMSVRELLKVDCFPIGPQITLYGEGYGAGIQQVGKFYRPDKSFILFDVRVGERWLDYEDVWSVGQILVLSTVPQRMLEAASIPTAMAYLAGKPMTSVSSLNAVQIEGLVGIPEVPLYNQWGERVIVKLKTKDHLDIVDGVASR